MNDAQDESLGQQTLDAYLSALASARPAPGGGSGATVAAAIGAALGEMVCNVTLARPSAPNREQLEALRERTHRLRDQLLNLATDDELAYGQYRAATRLPKSTEVEQQQRRKAIQAALHAASNVPLELLQACADLIDVLIEIAQLGSRSVVSDAQTGASLAAAAVKAAELNLRANATLLEDQAVADGLISRFASIAQTIPSRVDSVDVAATGQ